MEENKEENKESMLNIHLINGEVIKAKDLSISDISGCNINNINYITVVNKGEKSIVIPRASILYFKEGEDE